MGHPSSARKRPRHGSSTVPGHRDQFRPLYDLGNFSEQTLTIAPTAFDFNDFLSVHHYEGNPHTFAGDNGGGFPYRSGLYSRTTPSSIGRLKCRPLGFHTPVPDGLGRAIRTIASPDGDSARPFLGGDYAIFGISAVRLNLLRGSGAAKHPKGSALRRDLSTSPIWPP